MLSMSNTRALTGREVRELLLAHVPEGVRVIVLPSLREGCAFKVYVGRGSVWAASDIGTGVLPGSAEFVAKTLVDSDLPVPPNVATDLARVGDRQIPPNIAKHLAVGEAMAEREHCEECGAGTGPCAGPNAIQCWRLRRPSTPDPAAPASRGETEEDRAKAAWYAWFGEETDWLEEDAEDRAAWIASLRHFLPAAPGRPEGGQTP